MHAFRDDMMGSCIRGGLLYFVVSLSRVRNSKHFIMLLARAKLRFLRKQPDDFFFSGEPWVKPLQNGDRLQLRHL